MSTASISQETARQIPWQKIVARYQAPELKQSLWQLANTLIPYGALWYLMFRSLEISYWLTLALAVPTAGFMIRTFIIFHDCGHGSFFKQRKANEITGIITGILTFTPWQRWWHDHAIHHATAGDLDRRGVGDVKVLTVKEYLALPWWQKVGYRILRNPLVMFVIGAPLVFALFHRLPLPGMGRRERASVWWTNLALALLISLLCLAFGWREYLLVQLPVLFLGTAAGVWLFYVQHQFENVYWARHERWNFFDAALKGASFYKLPKLLQWFTGNIGFHHIHHLAPRIPNYNLEACHRENPLFHIPPLTLRSSLKCLKLRLYDEDLGKMVGWEGLKRYQQRLSAA